ncbi:hypothetical protein K435DRAFT_794931 [Dendrothele bispora CBS 962.96]|uniref:Uncharacterized protein n=1 Tax=Dendrothele bispora (strain CBS 962.96) TaxID=1314807 RepID=A0A4S8MB00_DENBC|nr:hypothetical protein K435DRAFT_794931 [Dendrothele bispora CBS 962.96]
MQGKGDIDDMKWAPLGRTSGLDGLWMFLVTLVSLMLSPGLEGGPMHHEELAWLTSWQVLMKVMVREPVEEEKESEMPQASGGAEHKVAEHEDDKDNKDDSPPSKRSHARGKEDEDEEDNEDNSTPSKRIHASKGEEDKDNKDNKDNSPLSKRIHASKKGNSEATPPKATTPQKTISDLNRRDQK